MHDERVGAGGSPHRPNAGTGPSCRVVPLAAAVLLGMEVGVEEASVTIKVVSINGRRMPKGIYQQLPRQSLLAADDCSVQGKPWGTIVEQKCCQNWRSRPHWHVLFEKEGELAVWEVPKHVKDAQLRFREGEAYEPRSGVDTAFIDAVALETHLGSSNWFEGRVFGLIREDQIVTTIEDTKVYLTCSHEVHELREARKEHASAVQSGLPAHWPSGVPTRLEKTENALKSAEDALRSACEQQGKDARELYADLVADVRLLKQARVNYTAAVAMAGQLPQLFLGA